MRIKVIFKEKGKERVCEVAVRDFELVRIAERNPPHIHRNKKKTIDRKKKNNHKSQECERG